MTRIIVFGAGGRAGRRVVAEAVARGHEVTAVVRDPAKYPGPAVTGDVTDPDSVAALAAGHDAAVNTTARLDVPAVDFYTAATKALVTGLARAGVARLVAVGIGSMLETAPGVAVHDAPAFPAEARAFSMGHVAELDVLRDSDLDWLVLAPPPVYLDEDAERTGEYRLGGTAVLPGGFSFVDLAVALVDEAVTPKHHRAMIAVGRAVAG